jgi:hypothetical protein
MSDICELIRSEGEETRRRFDRFAAHLKRDVYFVLISLANPAEIDALRKTVTDPSLFEQTLVEHERLLKHVEE